MTDLKPDIFHTPFLTPFASRLIHICVDLREIRASDAHPKIPQNPCGRKTPPQKDNKKPILRISVEEPAENPQALLFAHVRKGRKQPVNCPRPRYLRSAAKNDLSIRAKPQPYMGKMRACGVPYALILAYASQKQLPKFGCS